MANAGSAQRSVEAWPPSDLLPVPEVARIVGVHPESLYRLIRAGQFPPAVHVGKKVLVSAPRLKRFLHGDGDDTNGFTEAVG